MLYVFDCVICVSNCVEGHIHGMMYMGIKKLRGYCVGNYMHGIMRIGKMVNTKVKNYDLRDLDKETNMKVLNLFMSGWQLAPLRK